MSSDTIQTSTIIQDSVSHVLADDCKNLIDPCILFSPNHDYDTLTNPTSVVRSVRDDSPLLLKAFGMNAGERVVVEMAWGPKGGDLYQDMVVYGNAVTLECPDTVALLVIPGEYRFRYEGAVSGSGDATVVCQNTTCCTAQLMVDLHSANVTVNVSGTITDNGGSDV